LLKSGLPPNFDSCSLGQAWRGMQWFAAKGFGLSGMHGISLATMIHQRWTNSPL
jgi:hypothetical protein